MVAITGVRCLAAVHLEDVSIVTRGNGTYNLCDSDGVVIGNFTPARFSRMDGGVLQCGPPATITISKAASERFEKQILDEYGVRKLKRDEAEV